MTSRVLVISEDPVGAHMGGNAIRAYELACALAAHADVTLAAPSSGGSAPGVDRIPFDREDPGALRRTLREADVVVTLPQNSVVTAELRRSGARIVYDMYDPKPLQLLEAMVDAPGLVQRYWATITLDHTLEALARGDYLICASERQRDLWIGALLASRRITPATYRQDPSLRTRIDVVPFGVPSTPPQASGAGPRERWPALEADAEIVLWNGGLWNWLDPLCAVEAVARVLERRPKARLVFMGRPPFEARQAKAANAAKAYAKRLGLLDEIVFFNDEWVPYHKRADWLLAADCALSLHVEHLETRFSFRTRLLDCFWAGLPVVCTEGDDLSERVRRDGLGMTVAEADPRAAADGIVTVLERGSHTYREPLARAATDHRWPSVAAPLIDYIKDQQAERPPGGRAPVAPGRLARASAIRAARCTQRALRRLN